MAQITIGGAPAQTTGSLPSVGQKAPAFALAGTDLSDVALSDFFGKRVVLNIFPSIDTPVCANSVRRFNTEASAIENTEVLCISADLPFAHGRFCAAEGIEGVTSLSQFRDQAFGKDYGVAIAEGPLAGLLARAIVIVDESGTVIYAAFADELKEEPNYEEALDALS